jgi:hypothetical protein
MRLALRPVTRALAGLAVRLVALLAVAASGGCGLVEDDVSTVGFELMPVKYGIDTRLLNVPAAFWRLRCTPERDVCCEVFPCGSIPLVCQESACVTDFSFEAYATVDLRAEAPALTRLRANQVTDLYVTRIRYDADNLLNLDMPALDLYMAPVAVTTASDPQAEKFATLPALRAGAKARRVTVDVPIKSRELFARYARAWGAFNLIATAPVAIRSTMQPLAGQAVMTVVMEIGASLDL